MKLLEDKRTFKAELFEQFARVGSGLSHPVRLQIVEILAQGEKSVDALAQELGLPIANVSQHLQILRSASLVSVRRENKYGFYRLADEGVLLLWLAMRRVGESRIAEVDRIVSLYLSDREQFKPVAASELATRLAEENLVVIDVRPEGEYREGHIVGARSLPIEELELRLQEIPVDAKVVAYCRGPYCVFADEAVNLIRSQGREAYRLDVGFPDWKVMGLPTATNQDLPHKKEENVL